MKKISLKISVLLSLASCFLGRELIAVPGLVAIINTSRKATITVKGAIDKKTKQEITVYPASTLDPSKRYYFQPVFIPDHSGVAEDSQKFDNGLELEVQIGDTIYHVKIAQTRIEGNLLYIEAKAPEGGDAARVHTCVTNAINSGKILGLPPSPWQGIAIAFKDRATGTTNELPFNFVLTAWASNRNEWIGERGHFLKTSVAVDKDKTSFGKDEEGSTRYLTIVQGQQAIGGGAVPRPNRAHLVHVYNNTSYCLYINRTLSTGEGDKIIIPPYAVVPYLMEWIPPLTQSDLEGDEAARPGITMAVISLPKSRRHAAFTTQQMTGAMGATAIPTDTDVSDVLTNMQANFSGDASALLDVANVQQIMGAGVPKVALNTIYKIWVNAADKKIKLVAQDVTPDNALKPGQDRVPDKDIPTISDPAYVDKMTPGYFNLIVSESDNSKDPLSFKLTNLHDLETPFVK